VEAPRAALPPDEVARSDEEPGSDAAPQVLVPVEPPLHASVPRSGEELRSDAAQQV
jgi:hypothetical protein